MLTGAETRQRLIPTGEPVGNWSSVDGRRGGALGRRGTDIAVGVS